VREPNFRITWGSGVQTPSFNVKLDRVSPRSIYTVWANGKLNLNFGWLRGSETAETFRDRFKEAVDAIPGVSVPKSYRETLPTLPISLWGPRVDEFIEAIKTLQ
jgi:hypothetical protein